MSDDNLEEWRKEFFKGWIYQQIDCWLYEYAAWDGWLEDENEDFDEEDWEYIKNHLRVTDVSIEEV